MITKIIALIAIIVLTAIYTCCIVAIKERKKNIKVLENRIRLLEQIENGEF